MKYKILDILAAMSLFILLLILPFYLGAVFFNTLVNLLINGNI